MEICTSIKAVKYLYKYTYKGPDRACIEKVVNEVTDFLDARYLTAPEACWRIFGFPLHARSHAIERLPVHLPGEQLVPYMQGDEAGGADRGQSKDTKLQAFFKVSAKRREEAERSHAAGHAPRATPDEQTCPLRYVDVPNHYVWNTKTSAWQLRARTTKGGEVIGRMYQCSPKDPELYALRLLLSHTPGVESFRQLKVVEDRPPCATFREAARERGLLQSSEELELILEEMLGTQCSMAKACETCALLLVWHEIGDARDAWAKCWRQMVGLELRHGASDAAAHNAALRHVELTLDHFRLTAESFLLQYMADDAQPQ